MADNKDGKILEHGTLVRGLAGTQVKTWTDDYKATVIGFKRREDGGIDYLVRCWRQNTHWWHGEDIEAIPAADLCAACKGEKVTKCNCRCCHAC